MLLLSGCTSIGVEWMYKTKLVEKRKVDKYKGRPASKFFAQQLGTKNGEKFPLLERLDTNIRTMLVIGSQKQMDTLNGGCEVILLK